MPDENLAPLPSRQSEIARMTLAQLPPTTPLETVFQTVCRLGSAVIRVERAGVWFFEDDDTILKCVNLFEASKGTHTGGATLQVGRIPNYVASLRRRTSLPVEMVSVMPWTKELHADYCDALGITSILDAGIFHEGTLVGVFCLEHVGSPREWTTDDRDFAAALAVFVSSRLPAHSGE